jgi:hypothetical protein
MFFAVFLAVSLVGGIYYQLNLERESELKRQAERQYVEAQERAQRQHVEALKQYDRDLKSFKQLAH